MGVEREFLSKSPEATQELARRVGAQLQAGTVLALDGELGAGKTTFMRGLAEGLEVDEPVSSPTYTLMHEYLGRLTLYHFDAWMEGRERAFLEGGGAEEFTGDGVSAVEWAERVEEYLPLPRISVRLSHRSPEERVLSIRVLGESEALEALLVALEAPSDLEEVG